MVVSSEFYSLGLGFSVYGYFHNFIWMRICMIQAVLVVL